MFHLFVFVQSYYFYWERPNHTEGALLEGVPDTPTQLMDVPNRIFQNHCKLLLRNNKNLIYCFWTKIDCYWTVLSYIGHFYSIRTPHSTQHLCKVGWDVYWSLPTLSLTPHLIYVRSLLIPFLRSVVLAQNNNGTRTVKKHESLYTFRFRLDPRQTQHSRSAERQPSAVEEVMFPVACGRLSVQVHKIGSHHCQSLRGFHSHRLGSGSSLSHTHTHTRAHPRRRDYSKRVRVSTVH